MINPALRPHFSLYIRGFTSRREKDFLHVYTAQRPAERDRSEKLSLGVVQLHISTCYA